MERTLTEASQGLDVSQFAVGNIVDFNNADVDDVIIYITVSNTAPLIILTISRYKTGLWYAPVPDTSQMTNKEILNGMMVDSGENSKSGRATYLT